VGERGARDAGPPHAPGPRARNEGFYTTVQLHLRRSLRSITCERYVRGRDLCTVVHAVCTGKKAAQQFVKHSIVSKHLVTTKQIAKL
jgi:hypothetical protein